MDEAPSKRTSTSGVDPEPIYAGSEEDEDYEIPLHLRSRRSSAVVTIEKLLEEAAERQTTRDESVPTPMPVRIVPSGSLQSQGKSIYHKNILPGSPVEMMSSAGVLEQSPFTGLVGARLSAVGVLPTQYHLHHQMRN